VASPGIRSPPRHRARPRRSIASLIVLVIAFGLLLGSTLSPWWTLTFRGFGGPNVSSSISTYLPGSFESSGNNGTEVTCPMSGGPSSNGLVPCPALNQTSALYHGAFAMALASGAALGVAIALLGLRLASTALGQRGRVLGLGVAVLAVVLMGGAVGLIALGQPGAFAADSGSSPGATPFGIFPNWCPHTPADSFYAGCTSSTQSIRWTPALGWVLGALTIAFAFVGLGLGFRGPPSVRNVARRAPPIVALRPPDLAKTGPSETSESDPTG
jgi:hypothetical protein